MAVMGAAAAGVFTRRRLAGFFSADEVRSIAAGAFGAATAFSARLVPIDFFADAFEGFFATFLTAAFFAAFFAVFFTLFLPIVFDALRDFLAADLLAPVFFGTRAGEALRAFLAFFFLEVLLAFATTNFL